MRRPVWPFILNLRQTGLLSAVVMTLVVLTREPARQVEESPIWSIPTGHLHGVEAAAFSPDGQRLATGGDDGSVVIWQVGKGVETEFSHGRSSRVVCMAFSPDGTTLATGHDNSTIVLWDVTTGKERAKLTGRTHRVLSLDFSPDGATLATGGGESSIRLWDVASGKIKATLCGHRHAVCASVLPRMDEPWLLDVALEL